jgi:hypothetical protein
MIATELQPEIPKKNTGVLYQIEAWKLWLSCCSETKGTRSGTLFMQLNSFALGHFVAYVFSSLILTS